MDQKHRFRKNMMFIIHIHILIIIAYIFTSDNSLQELSFFLSSDLDSEPSFENLGKTSSDLGEPSSENLGEPSSSENLGEPSSENLGEPSSSSENLGESSSSENMAAQSLTELSTV